jgi:hypothetical protein
MFGMQVPPNSVADVQLCYKPGSYRTREEGMVCISSQAAGSYEYVCIGQVRQGLSTMPCAADVGIVQLRYHVQTGCI